MALPVQWGVGAPLASGKQWISWIHIDDLCRLYIEAMENPQWHGIYNAVASTPVTNETFTRQVAEVLHRPLWLPNIPSVVLKTLFGEMSSLVIGGNYVINQRIKAETNFIFQFNDLKIALLNLYGK
jgi:NAD dependent epimerase/dehydratase family enzyme